MSTELAIRKQELKLEKQKLNQDVIKSAVEGAATLLKNPVLEIVLGYLFIEWAQSRVVDEITTPAIPPQPGLQWDWKTGFLGNLWDKGTPGKTEKHYLIGPTAGSIAEAGILVAVAMQQPATMELMKSAIAAGGESMGTLLKLLPAAFTALK
jgi:hypothetical protein